MKLFDIVLIARDVGGIGDYVCLTGLIRLIARRWPRKAIVLLTGNTEVFLNHARVRKVVHVKSKWMGRMVRYSFRILGALGLPAYNFRYGNGGKGQEEYIRNNPQMHYIEVNSRHMSLGLEYADLENEIWLTPEERERFSIRHAGLPTEYVLIHSCGKTDYTPNKEVGPSVFQAIVRAAPEVRFVQVGLADDPPLEGCLDYRGQTGCLRELFCLMAGAKAVVCQEGAYNHLASAFGVPAVTLFTGFSPVATYSYSTTHAIQQDPLPACSPCLLRCPCPRGMVCAPSGLADRAALILRNILGS